MSDATPSFAAQQAWLQSAIAAPTDGALYAQAPQFLCSSATLDAGARLAIYQRSYRARLLDAFHAIFPALLHALGAAALDTFALAFLAAHRPSTHSVGRIADGFDAYLEATRPPPAADEASGWEDFVLDLARLELALLAVSEAPGLESSPLPDAHDLRATPDAELLRLRPVPAPCLRLLACSHPVHRYWHAVRDGAQPEQPAPAPVRLALTRIDYRLSTRELAPVQWELLTRCDGRRTLHEILDAIADLGLRPRPHAALARIWLGNFLAQGLLAAAGDDG